MFLLFRACRSHPSDFGARRISAPTTEAAGQGTGATKNRSGSFSASGGSGGRLVASCCGIPSRDELRQLLGRRRGGGVLGPRESTCSAGGQHALIRSEDTQMWIVWFLSTLVGFSLVLSMVEQAPVSVRVRSQSRRRSWPGTSLRKNHATFQFCSVRQVTLAPAETNSAPAWRIRLAAR